MPLNPKPSTLNPLNPEHGTLNPKPWTLHRVVAPQDSKLGVAAPGQVVSKGTYGRFVSVFVFESGFSGLGVLGFGGLGVLGFGGLGFRGFLGFWGFGVQVWDLLA